MLLDLTLPVTPELRHAAPEKEDRFCADHGVFVVENLCGLQALVAAGGSFIAHTYPVNYMGMTGLPCRVIAETV